MSNVQDVHIDIDKLDTNIDIDIDMDTIETDINKDKSMDIDVVG